MKPPAWLRIEAVLAVHCEMALEFGGPTKVRDSGLLASALARPENLFAYGKPTLFELAAAYAAGIIHNHPFMDGNKRAGFLAAYIFLSRNGYLLLATEPDAAAATLALAANELTEAEYARWLEAHCRADHSRL